jgi:hypothetical protein
MHPLVLSQEEIDELLKVPIINTPNTYTSNYNKGYGMWDYDYPTPAKSYTRHEWIPVLLLNHTVYDCSKCGAHKEKTEGIYCDDQDTF